MDSYHQVTLRRLIVRTVGLTASIILEICNWRDMSHYLRKHISSLERPTAHKVWSTTRVQAIQLDRCNDLNLDLSIQRKASNPNTCTTLSMESAVSGERSMLQPYPGWNLPVSLHGWTPSHIPHSRLGSNPCWKWKWWLWQPCSGHCHRQ